MPKAMPEPMDTRIAAISSALPWADLKRISPKAPPMATPAPMLPFTNVMTALTTKGIMALTMKTRFVDRTRKLMIQE